MNLKKILVLVGTILMFALITMKDATKNIKSIILEENLNYTEKNYKTIAMYKNDGNEDEEIATMPESGYTINTEKSYCTVDNINKVYNKMYTDENGKHIITGLDKDSKCYIYFDKKTINGSAGILANIKVNEGTPDFSQVATIDEGVFKTQDDDGDAYYWRGAVENNYVKFANKYWRLLELMATEQLE